MSFTFTQENLKKIENLKKRYPSVKALSLPCLWMVQSQEGYISIEAIEEISRQIATPPIEIYRVATFYTMFHLEPQIQLNIAVCKTLSCKLCGSDEILKYLKNKNVKITHAECLGSCGTAPVIQINDVNYENLTVQKVENILGELL